MEPTPETTNDADDREPAAVKTPPSRPGARRRRFWFELDGWRDERDARRQFVLA